MIFSLVPVVRRRRHKLVLRVLRCKTILSQLFLLLGHNSLNLRYMFFYAVNLQQSLCIFYHVINLNIIPEISKENISGEINMILTISNQIPGSSSILKFDEKSLSTIMTMIRIHLRGSHSMSTRTYLISVIFCTPTHFLACKLYARKMRTFVTKSASRQNSVN